jgi:nucleotide-binding universal stress UspA family protein
MYRRILAPIDQSATAQHGLDAAFSMAKAYGASLVFLHVVEFQPFTLDPAGAVVIAEVMDDLRNAGQELLQAAHDRAKAAGIASEVHQLEAPTARVGDVIVEQAREHQCNLIVMGSHGRRGMDRVLLGSDAERVVRLATVAVLIVRGTGV